MKIYRKMMLMNIEQKIEALREELVNLGMEKIQKIKKGL